MVQELCWLFCEGGMSSNNLLATLIPSKPPFKVAIKHILKQLHFVLFSRPLYSYTHV